MAISVTMSILAFCTEKDAWRQVFYPLVQHSWASVGKITLVPLEMTLFILDSEANEALVSNNVLPVPRLS